MSAWKTRTEYPGTFGDSAKFLVFADGSDSRIAILAIDRLNADYTVIAMTADQAEAFARDLLDAAMSLQEEQADD